MKKQLHTLDLQNGKQIHVFQEGKKFIKVNEVGVNGLFSKGGFFDKAITAGSKVFKKEDGSPTFVGESIQEVAAKFGTQLANNVTNNSNLQTTQMPNFDFQPLSQNNGSNLPLRTDNPLPEKDNTALWIGGGLAAAALIGGGIFLATRKN